MRLDTNRHNMHGFICIVSNARSMISDQLHVNLGIPKLTNCDKYSIAATSLSRYRYSNRSRFFPSSQKASRPLILMAHNEGQKNEQMGMAENAKPAPRYLHGALLRGGGLRHLAISFCPSFFYFSRPDGNVWLYAWSMHVHMRRVQPVQHWRSSIALSPTAIDLSTCVLGFY
ncbi:hypothetical protein BJV74DRAFT_461441 [Russula compacta]|nr:hypothetical protein BJV74DRAFT_461441 [Russula compacta]